jgi:hypothetical protein
MECLPRGPGYALAAADRPGNAAEVGRVLRPGGKLLLLPAWGYGSSLRMSVHTVS